METPALKQLMQAYFHQDWDMDGTPEEVVDVFLREETTLAPLLESETERVLDSFDGEEETATFVRSLRPDYDPHARYGGYRSWLAAIAERARQHSP